MQIGVLHDYQPEISISVIKFTDKYKVKNSNCFGKILWQSLRHEKYSTNGGLENSCFVDKIARQRWMSKNK